MGVLSVGGLLFFNEFSFLPRPGLLGCASADPRGLLGCNSVFFHLGDKFLGDKLCHVFLFFVSLPWSDVVREGVNYVNSFRSAYTRTS